jgi:hypothetical protein
VVKQAGFRDFAITWKSFETFDDTEHQDGARLFKTAGINFKGRKP